MIDIYHLKKELDRLTKASNFNRDDEERKLEKNSKWNDIWNTAKEYKFDDESEPQVDETEDVECVVPENFEEVVDWIGDRFRKLDKHDSDPLKWEYTMTIEDILECFNLLKESE